MRVLVTGQVLVPKVCNMSPINKSHGCHTCSAPFENKSFTLDKLRLNVHVFTHEQHRVYSMSLHVRQT